MTHPIASPVKRPEAVWFDLGGTVLRESRIDLRGATEWLLRDAVTSPGRVTLPEVQALYSEIRQELRNGPVEFQMTGFLHLVCDWAGIKLDAGLDSIELEFWQRLCSMEPVPGIKKALAHLKKEGIAAGIISNSVFSRQVLEYELQRNHLLDFFSVIVSSAEYGLQKPHPAIYKAALGRGRIAPERAWFVGDNLEKDIRGAAAVGMQPVLYLPEPATDEPPPGVHCIRNWDEFVALLAP